MVFREYIAFGRPNFPDEDIAAVTAVMRLGWVDMRSDPIAFKSELAEF
jgi:hypothetical protein